MAVKNAPQAENIGDAERNKNLEITIAQIEKEFGKGSIMRLGDSATYAGDVQVISTGALSLDLALGIGGLPKGRIVEIFGPESSGKTTVCLHVIANAQKAGGRCAIVGVTKRIERFIHVSGLDKAFELYKDEDEALAVWSEACV